MKTRSEFLEAHRHELAGLVLDGATEDRRGAAFACWARGVMRRIDEKLSAVYDEFVPPKNGHANGNGANGNGVAPHLANGRK